MSATLLLNKNQFGCHNYHNQHHHPHHHWHDCYHRNNYHIIMAIIIISFIIILINIIIVTTEILCTYWLSGRAGLENSWFEGHIEVSSSQDNKNTQFIEKTRLLSVFFSFKFLRQSRVSAGPDGFSWTGSRQPIRSYNTQFSMGLRPRGHTGSVIVSIVSQLSLLFSWFM